VCRLTDARLRRTLPLPAARTPLLLYLAPAPPHIAPTFFPCFPLLQQRNRRADPSSPAIPVAPSRPRPSTLLPPSHHPHRLLSAPVIREPFSVTESTPLPPFPPPLVKVDPKPLFFHLSFASPLPCDLGAPMTLIGRRRPPELHHRLERHHRHPNPPPHRCHATSVSLTAPTLPDGLATRCRFSFHRLHAASIVGAPTTSTPPHRPACVHRALTAPRCLAWAGPAKFAVGPSQRVEASGQMEAHYYSSRFNFHKMYLGLNTLGNSFKFQNS
jgi:hypothetical protein